MTRLQLLTTGTVFAILLFGTGLLIGREFPAHRFQQVGTGFGFLYDTSTGRVCATQVGRTGDPVDANGQPVAPDPFEKYRVDTPAGGLTAKDFGLNSSTPPSSAGNANVPGDLGGAAPSTKFSLPPCNR